MNIRPFAAWLRQAMLSLVLVNLLFAGPASAQQVSKLPAATNITGDELVPCTQGMVTKKCTVSTTVAATNTRAGIGPKTLSNIGTRIFGGRMEYVQNFAAAGTGSARTWAVRTVAAAPTFLAVRIRLAISQTASTDSVTPTFLCDAAALPDKSDASIAAASYTLASFNGVGQPTLTPAAAAGRRAFLTSDWMPITSVPRTDGGSFPMLDVQCAMYSASAAGNVVIMGAAAGADSYLNWATRPDGRIWDIRTKGGSYVGAGTGNQMTTASTAAANYSPIIGFDYLTDGGVITVGAAGDSITEGRATYLEEGFVLNAINELQASSGIPYEFANLGWSGQTSALIRQNVIDAMAAGIRADAFFVPNFSPNDRVSSALLDSDITTLRSNLGLELASLRGAGVQPIIWTGIPVNFSVRPYGTSDGKRIASNTLTKSAAAYGAIVADFATPVSGPVDVNGQTTLLNTADNIHPNDAGYAAMKPAVKAAISRAVQPLGGLLAQ